MGARRLRRASAGSTSSSTISSCGPFQKRIVVAFGPAVEPHRDLEVQIARGGRVIGQRPGAVGPAVVEVGLALRLRRPVYGLVGVIVNVSSCMPNPNGPLHVIWPKSKPGVVASGFCCALSLTGHAIVSAFFVASPRRQLRRMRMRALPPWRAQSPRRSI